jgi:hypothetical protein
MFLRSLRVHREKTKPDQLDQAAFSPRLRVSALNSVLPCGKWQQGDVAGPLNGRGQAALVRRAYSGQPAWDNLAPFRHELAEQAHVFVINVVNLLHAEFADLLAPEKLATAIAAAGTTIRARTIRPAAAMWPWRWG